MSNGQTISIHGKEYKPVAMRVNEFRDLYPISTGWGIHSEIISIDAERVVVRSFITTPEGVTVGVGFAEEVRKSSKINATSALENCETSAIGRALAACGFAGTEYASANEVQGAIAAQEGIASDLAAKAAEAVEKGDWLAACLLDKHDDPMWLEAWKTMGSKVRSAFKELQKIRDAYRDDLNRYAEADDEHGFQQTNDELNREQAVYLFRIIGPKAQELMTTLRKAA